MRAHHLYATFWFFSFYPNHTCQSFFLSGVKLERKSNVESCISFFFPTPFGFASLLSSQIALSICIFTVFCLCPPVAPQRQRGLLCKLSDDQDIVVEEERKRRLRLQCMWFIPKTTLGKSFPDMRQMILDNC